MTSRLINGGMSMKFFKRIKDIFRRNDSDNELEWKIRRIVMEELRKN